MQHMTCMGILLVIGLAGLSGQGRAQQMIAAETGIGLPAPPQTSRLRSGLDAFVSLQVDNVSITDALDMLARESGVRISYGSHVIPENKTVSLSVDRVRLGDVLAKVLKGTGAEAQATAGGQVTIARTIGAHIVSENGVVAGKVINASTKAPVANATIFIGDSATGIATGTDGVFRLTVSPGEHTLRIRALGYVRYQTVIVVKEGETVTVEAVVTPSANVLDEIIVTGTVTATERKAIATPITVITADEIEKRAITRIEQLFRGEVPGLFVSEEGAMAYSVGNSGTTLGNMETANVYSRGSASLNGGTNPIKTYIDGVELLDPSYLGTIDPQSIERIEIVTGPQAATIYGSGALGGVMQIFTKKGRGMRAFDVTASVKYGMLNNSVSSSLTPLHNDVLSMAGGSGSEFSYAGTLSYNYTGQWQPHLFTRAYGVSVGLTHVRGPVTINGSFSSRNGENGTNRAFDAYDGPVWNSWVRSGKYAMVYPQYGGQANQRVSKSSSQTVSLNGDYQPLVFWQHHISVGYSQTAFALDPLSPVFLTSTDSLLQIAKSTGKRTTVSYNMTLLSNRGLWSSVLTLGGNGSAGEQIRVSGCLTSHVATSYVGCSASSSPTVGQPLNETSWGVFSNWRLGVFDRLYLTLGLRGERNPNYGQSHKLDLTPTNGVAYSFEHDVLTVKVLGSYGRSTRAPTPSQRLENVSISSTLSPAQFISRLAAPDLTPEYSRGPQGGVEIYYGNTLSLTVNHYQQTVTDLIQLVTVDSMLRTNLSTGTETYSMQSQYQNVAKIRQKGWESTMSFNLGIVSFKGTYSWNDSRVLAVNPRASTSYAPGQSFRDIPSHLGSVTFGYARGGTSLTLVTNIVGARPVHRSSTMVYYDNYPSFVRLGMYSDHRRNAFPEYQSGPGYAKSDLAMHQTVTDWITATVNITNLGNSFAAEGISLYPSLGRQTLLGISLKYPMRR